MTVKDEIAAHTGEEGSESVLVDRVEVAERVMEDGMHGTSYVSAIYTVAQCRMPGLDYFYVSSRTLNIIELGRRQTVLHA